MISSDDYLFIPYDLPNKNLQLPPDYQSQPGQNQPLQAQKSESNPSLTELESLDASIGYIKKAGRIIQRIDAKHEVVFHPKNYKSEVTQKFIKLINALKMLQAHLDFILEISLAPSDTEVPDIVVRYQSLDSFYKPITRKSDICTLSIVNACETIIFPLLKEIERITDGIFAYRVGDSEEIIFEGEGISFLQIITWKLEIALEYLPNSLTLESDNIFAHKRTSEVWKKLYESTETVVLADKETLKSRFRVVHIIFWVASAMMYKSDRMDKKSMRQKVKTALSGFYYGAKLREAQIQSGLYLTQPKMESAFQIWNLPEKKWIKEVMKLALPTIDYDNKIYVKRLFPPITKETVLKEYEENSFNTITDSTFQPEDLSAKKDAILETIFDKNPEAVKIRIISPYPLVIRGTSSEKARATAMKAVNGVKDFLKSGKSKSLTEIQGVIIHIHGGGFVSGSSSSHRLYLYRWAKKLNRIIFSIDYRLAPDHPYPACVDDVWQAYNWIINYAEPLLGIKTNKTIVAGDSAGGNLAAVICLRAIKMGIKVPDGCFMAYPALSMHPKTFVPSYFQAIEDPILPASMLNLCIKAYIPDEFKPMIDPLLSPGFAGDELLARMPPTRIITGTGDPLHDVNWQFLHRMRKLDKDIRMVVYDNMPHGFLSFDAIEEYKIVLDGTFKLFDELFLACGANKADDEEKLAS